MQIPIDSDSRTATHTAGYESRNIMSCSASLAYVHARAQHNARAGWRCRTARHAARRGTRCGSPVHDHRVACALAAALWPQHCGRSTVAAAPPHRERAPTRWRPETQWWRGRRGGTAATAVATAAAAAVLALRWEMTQAAVPATVVAAARQWPSRPRPAQQQHAQAPQSAMLVRSERSVRDRAVILR